VALLGTVIAAPMSAQSADVERQLVAARDTVWRAWFANDTALLRRYLPPAMASAEGTPEIRWSDRTTVVGGSREFARSKARLAELEFSNTRIVQLGQSALVHSTFLTVVQQNGRVDSTRGRATELFVRHGKTWINPYWQLEDERSPLNGGREIQLPDTLGANFSIGDSAKKAGTPEDYDALLGTWVFRYQTRRNDGNFDAPVTGYWTFEKKPGDGLIEDRWRPDDPSSPMGQSLYSYRLFDAERKVWQLVGTSSYGPGEVQPGLTWSDGKNRYVIQRARSRLSRIRYLSIDADHFLWRSDRSTDGGKTWIRDGAIMEARRVGK
jgi:hypothetical protein